MMKPGAPFLLIALIISSLLLSCKEKDIETATTERDWKLIKRNVLSQAPKIQHPLDVELEGRIKLLGYDVSADKATAGEALTITWYWQCVKEMNEDWMIFLHIDDMKGTSRVNGDHHPMKGLYKTSLWKKGEIIRDIQTVHFRPDWNGEEAIFWVGGFIGEQRMVVLGNVQTDGEDRIKAGTIKVVRKAGQKAAPQSSNLPNYEALRASGPIAIDGKLDEEAWKEAKPTSLFVRTMGPSTATLKTTARLLWDDTKLYIAFEADDHDIWGTKKNRDEAIYEEEALEIYLDANNDQKDYAEIQVSPHNVVFDAWFVGYRSNLDQAKAWTSGVESAVEVKGTLDNREDKDQSWTVELAIPFQDIKDAPQKPPKGGDKWRANLYRLDRPKEGPPEATAWSPPQRPDFHTLDRFGTIEFIERAK